MTKMTQDEHSLVENLEQAAVWIGFAMANAEKLDPDQHRPVSLFTGMAARAIRLALRELQGPEGAIEGVKDEIEMLEDEQ